MRNNPFVGFYIDGKHTYNDYGLFLSAPPDFGTPEPKTVYVNIPGRNEPLDYTEAMTGEVMYNPRQIHLVFATEIKRDKREELISRLRSDLHGRIVEQLIYDLDADYYYTGRASVTFEDVQSWRMKVIIDIPQANPYKLAVDQTILTVEPANFTAERISLGKGTAAQKPNSIFTFGTAQNPQLDLTQFSSLVFRWEDFAEWGTPSIQIEDNSGATFNTTFQPDAVGTGFYQKTIAVSAITGINKSFVYRILCRGRSYVELTGVTQASASVIVPVDRMTVVPIWTASEAVTVFANGRKFSLPAGASRDYNLRLAEGENQVSFIADSENATVQIQFQDGRL